MRKVTEGEGGGGGGEGEGKEGRRRRGGGEGGGGEEIECIHYSLPHVFELVCLTWLIFKLVLIVLQLRCCCQPLCSLSVQC